MRVLMLVATGVANDTRVLREAGTLVDAGHQVHIVGKSVPEGYLPPDGVTVSSIGTSSVFRAEGSDSLGAQKIQPHVRLARWILLPQHRNSTFTRWAKGAVDDAQGRDFDVVHAHDYTALEAGAHLAAARGIPLVYDAHELWSGMSRDYRPTPLQDRRESKRERVLGGAAAAVITVGDGVADALRSRYGWDHVSVVRNTFAQAPGGPPPKPTGAVYAGRLAPFRELEVIAEASEGSPVPITLIGPSDATWLATFRPGRTHVLPPVSMGEATRLLQSAGIALVTLGDVTAENQRLALPNKVFQAVAAGIPVVATDVGELGALMRKYGLGTLYEPGDARGLLAALQRLTDEYAEYCARVAAARTSLIWNVDADVLLRVYSSLGGRESPAAS